jgi:hypothetical protein
MKRSGYTMLSIAVALLMTSVTLPADAQRRRGHVREKRVVVVHRPHRTVVVRRAHVRYASLPRWGTTVNVVPAGAVVIKARRDPYYFHHGIFYARRGPGFVIVRPARGIRVRVLPAGYRTVVVGPRNYYYYYGTFYAKAASAEEEYIVTDAPEGAVVDALPDGYQIKTVDGNEYYELDGVYYAEVDAPEFDDGVGYEVIKL